MTMRRAPCDHDKVYSGQINLSQRYAFICRRCGECSWDLVIDISRVNADEYYVQRVAHGWAAPSRIPKSPRAPTRVDGGLVPGRRIPVAWALWYQGVVACSISSLLCILMGAGKVVTWSSALIAAGSALLAATVCFVCLARAER